MPFSFFAIVDSVIGAIASGAGDKSRRAGLQPGASGRKQNPRSQQKQRLVIGVGGDKPCVILTRPLSLREGTDQHSALGHDAEDYRARPIKTCVARRCATFNLGDGSAHGAEPFIGDGSVATYLFERRMRFRQRAVLRGNDPVGGGKAGIAHPQLAHSDALQRRVAARLASICAAVSGAAGCPACVASARMVWRDFADSHATCKA